MSASRRFARAATTVVAALALAAVVAVPALAAPPVRETFDLDDPAAEASWSAFLTDACGFPVAVDFAGSVTSHVFLDTSGEWSHQVDKWWIRDRFTNVATGATILLKDVGPDVYRIDRDGHLTIAITGRSLTGSGVIGRVVVDLDTGEVVHMAGREVGSVPDQVCPAID